MDKKTNNTPPRVTIYDKINISPLGRDLIIAVLSALLLGIIIYAAIASGV